MDSITQTKLSKYLKDFKEAVFTAYNNYTIWWLYKSERPKYVDVMNKYLGFFTNSIYAHFVAMLMAITSILDKKSHKYNSLYSFISFLEDEKILDESVLINIKNIEDEIAPFVPKLMILRNNIFAHISAKLDSDKTFEMANLRYDDFRDVIFHCGDILDIVLREITKTRFYYNYNPGSVDTESLLNDLILLEKKLDSK